MIVVRQHRIFGLGKVTGRIRISNCRMLAEVNHYDFHARQLQLPIPHFYQQDPYADKYPHLSPYLYCAANPLRYVDPGGCEFNIIDFKVQKTIKNTLSKEDAICLIKDKLAILVLSCKNYG